MSLSVFSFSSLVHIFTQGKILLIIFTFSFLLSGCQVLTNANKDTVGFTHYYLWIKSLNDEEIIQEIKHQKSNKELGLVKTDIQLIMLHSLPNSPIHNPYTAKTKLNDYQLGPNEETVFNTTDLAFVVMLKDQLNQQLLILESLNNYKGAYTQSNHLIDTQQSDIALAKQKISQLNKKIIQLKKIEKAISKHVK
jgi:hypothetical protein